MHICTSTYMHANVQMRNILISYDTIIKSDFLKKKKIQNKRFSTYMHICAYVHIFRYMQKKSNISMCRG